MNTALKSISQTVAPTLESLLKKVDALESLLERFETMTRKLNSTSNQVEALSKQSNSATLVTNILVTKLAQLNHRLPGLMEPLIIHSE